ncbi:hypothetical protein APUTEX25_002488, partial [Auxenochlorella protothecoides]
MKLTRALSCGGEVDADWAGVPTLGPASASPAADVGGVASPGTAMPWATLAAASISSPPPDTCSSCVSRPGRLTASSAAAWGLAATMLAWLRLVISTRKVPATPAAEARYSASG